MHRPTIRISATDPACARVRARPVFRPRPASRFVGAGRKRAAPLVLWRPPRPPRQIVFSEGPFLEQRAGGRGPLGGGAEQRAPGGTTTESVGGAGRGGGPKS